MHLLTKAIQLHLIQFTLKSLQVERRHDLCLYCRVIQKGLPAFSLKIEELKMKVLAQSVTSILGALNLHTQHTHTHMH